VKCHHKLTLTTPTSRATVRATTRHLLPPGARTVFLFRLARRVPSSDGYWEKIDAPEAARLLDLVGDVIDRLAGGIERPRFVAQVQKVMADLLTFSRY